MDNPYVERIGEATGKLLASVGRLDDVAATGHSLLPEWDRSMVVTHLAANADGTRRALEAAARGEVVEVYPGGRPARNAEIAAGRARPARELEQRLRRACEQLAVALANASDDAWEARALHPSGEVRIGPGLVVSRLREVEVHHVDLDYGYDPQDWPFAWVLEEMDRAMIDLPARLPPGVAVVLTGSDAGQHWVAGSGDGVEIIGTTNDLFAWLTGRAPGVGEQECPPLTPWR
ncbi:MAG: maleylpyruvate isomerase family mycothiol-dependent enzyme [Acidimicrobiales bacterium]|jgi:maleylpyruvate isomerase